MLSILLFLVAVILTAVVAYRLGIKRGERGAIHLVPSCPNDGVLMDKISYSCPVCHCSTGEHRTPQSL